MLVWSVILFVLALISGYIGFRKQKKRPASFARTLCFLFLALFLITFILGLQTSPLLYS